MIRLFRYLLGYVCFEFSKGFIDGFVNSCYLCGVNVYDLKRQDNSVIAKCSAKDYKRLHTLAHKNGGVVRITKRRGLLFPLLKLRNRWGLFAGALAFVMIINFLGGFVWNIEVNGNEKIETSELLTFCQKNGLYRGVYWSNDNADKLEGLIMTSFEDCGWVHINRFGSTARIDISEAVIKPDVDDNTGVANLKATKDGVIVKTTVKNGWQTAFIGDGVTKGDILVSGVYENEEKKVNLFAHAAGEFIAQVNEPIKISVSRYQKNKRYIYSEQYKTLFFFGAKIPLYIGKIDKKDADLTTDTNYVLLNNKTLPIGIIQTTAKKYTVEETALDDNALMKLISSETDKKIKNDFRDYEIVSKDINITLNAENGTAEGTVICLENIGEEVMLSDVKPGLTLD